MAAKKKTKKSMTLGGGGRFSAFTAKLKKEGYSPKAAGAIAYSAGVKAHGKKAMTKMAAKGRKRAAAKRKRK